MNRRPLRVALFFHHRPSEESVEAAIHFGHYAHTYVRGGWSQGATTLIISPSKIVFAASGRFHAQIPETLPSLSVETMYHGVLEHAMLKDYGAAIPALLSLHRHDPPLI